MKNLFKNYRNQDSGLRSLDELFIISFLGISIVFLAILILQGSAMKQLQKDLEVIKLDKKVVALDEDTYKKLIEKGVTERLIRNGMR